MLNQCLENIGEGLLHACIYSIEILQLKENTNFIFSIIDCLSNSVNKFNDGKFNESIFSNSMNLFSQNRGDSTCSALPFTASVKNIAIYNMIIEILQLKENTNCIFPLLIAWVILSTSSMIANSMNLFSLKPYWCFVDPIQTGEGSARAKFEWF